MFKIGICNELFEDVEFSRMCRLLKQIGYDGVEIAPFTLSRLITDLSPDRRREIKLMVEDAGLETIVGCTGCWRRRKVSISHRQRNRCAARLAIT